MVLTLLATTLALQGAHGAAPRVPPAKAAALRDSLEAAELRFFRAWGAAWRASETERHAVTASEFETTTRNLQLHCHPPEGRGAQPYLTTPTLGRGATITTQPTMMKTPDTYYAVCPTWWLSDVKGVADERSGIDVALSPAHRDAMHTARANVLADLDSAAQLLPADDWIAGQRVRFRVDQRELDTAAFVARDCRATRWWCLALTGYVDALSGDVVAADSVFADAAAAMPAARHCAWSDLSALLDAAGRAAYGRLTCRQRDSVSARFWWLADPLYIEPGNERRVEQNVRNVLIALHGALDHDERFDWRPATGQNVLERVIARYGWPAYMWWGGVRNESSHSDYLAQHATPLNDTYASFEYSFDRMHAFPAWRAVLDPLHARRNDWEISRPDSLGADTLWWPREHFAPHTPILQMSDGQLAFLRRQDTVLLALATDLDGAKFNRPRTTPIAATAVVTDRPGSQRVVGQAEGSVRAPLLVRAEVSSRPVLLSVEFPGVAEHALPGGRTRFAIAPPPTLAAMKPGQYAISDPVMLLPPADGDELPAETDAAIARMAGSTVVQKTRKLGVFWETYGFKQTDSVDVAVWIERYTPQGILRRFGIALSVAVDLNTPVVISWKEPQSNRLSSFLPGAVPILSRSVTLDVSGLPRGDYWLEVAVAKRGVAPVRGRRSFTIQ